MKHSNTLNHLQKADIETFNKDGVVCLKGAIRPQEIDLLRSDVHEMIKNKAKSQTSYDFENLQQQFWSGEEILQAGESDRFDLQMYKLVLDTDPDARPIRDQVSEEGNGSFFYDAGQWRFHDGIKTVALNSSLPEISAQLMDSEYINFMLYCLDSTRPSY